MMIMHKMNSTKFKYTQSSRNKNWKPFLIYPNNNRKSNKMERKHPALILKWRKPFSLKTNEEHLLACFNSSLDQNQHQRNKEKLFSCLLNFQLGRNSFKGAKREKQFFLLAKFSAWPKFFQGSKKRKTIFLTC